jgi:hypothetical protein
MLRSRKFAKPIVLKDGRTIANLGQARMVILSQPDRKRFFWQYAAELLLDAATSGDERAIEDARSQLLRALKAERLV